MQATGYVREQPAASLLADTGAYADSYAGTNPRANAGSYTDAHTYPDSGANTRAAEG